MPLYKLFIRLITTYKVVTPFSISELPEAEPACVSVTKPEASVVNSSALNLLPVPSSFTKNPSSSCNSPTLPIFVSTPKAGLTFRFASYNLTAADGHDVQFQISGGGTGLFFQGGLTHLDTNADNIGIFTDNNSNDFLNVHVPQHYDITFVGHSATLYLVTGTVTSATAPTFADAAD